MPYTYVFDFRYLKSNPDLIKNSILIFDEAHNLESAAEEGFSTSITTGELKDLIKILEKFNKYE